MASATKTITYSGLGHAGVWSDAQNWVGGVVPVATNTALFTSSAVLNGPIEVSTLMLLGNESITIDGHIKTDATNACLSFMICEGATVTFAAGSSLTDAGGFDSGIDATGIAIVDGASGNQAAAVLNTTIMKIGQDDGGNGTLTVAGGIVNNSGAAYIGLDGTGVLNVSAAGQANFAANLVVGDSAGATGAINLTGSGEVDVGGWLWIGTAVPGGPGGIGTATVHAGTSLTTDGPMLVGAGSRINLAGGTVTPGATTLGLQIRQGATVSGYGTIASATGGVTDNGLLAVSGGTLSVTGNISGMGQAEIGAGCTLDLISSHIRLPAISFMGSGATLGLTTGVTGAFTIAGFAAGDRIVMNGIDAVSWNGATQTLAISDHGQVLDRLVLTGVAADAVFNLAPTTGGSAITLLPGAIAEAATAFQVHLQA